MTLVVPDDDRYAYGEAYLRAVMVTALGGRAAEEVIYGSSTTDTEQDLKQVTEIARAMVTRWGMSSEIGLVVLSGAEEGNYLESGLGSPLRPYSEETAQAIDRATRRIVDECYTQALSLLTRERQRLDALAAALLREESLDETQMRAATDLEERHGQKCAITAARQSGAGQAV